ncbi:MAG: hypothetical protein V2I76_01430 [Roseobacter sp.]|jgi:hypothetical protein|nr:hypothetical protein [Roseobacter sp.]
MMIEPDACGALFVLMFTTNDKGTCLADLERLNAQQIQKGRGIFRTVYDTARRGFPVPARRTAGFVKRTVLRNLIAIRARLSGTVVAVYMARFSKGFVGYNN